MYVIIIEITKPKMNPPITCEKECPNIVLRFSGVKGPSLWISESSLDHSFITSACFPASQRMFIASWMTIREKTIEIAKYTLVTPSVIPMEVVKATTVAVWLEGIPPVESNWWKLKPSPISLLMKGFIPCAISHAKKAETRGALSRIFSIRVYNKETSDLLQQ